MIASLLLMAAAPAACPAITVRGGSVTPGAGWFIVLIDPLPQTTYTTKWTISGGTISSGQGKARIEIEAPEANPVTATVEIGGLPKECRDFASETVFVEGKVNCPLLGVEPGLTPKKETTFRATADPIPTGDFTFSWTVSAGAISQGQGTGNIIVEGPKGTQVTATMDVGGLPPECGRSASATTEIGAQ